MPPVTSTWIGQSLENGRFLVQEKLGEGGMAVVYRATDVNTSEEVVIKVPKQTALEDQTFLKRFARENHTLSRLKHPHIVPILHVGEQDGWPFTVLKYLSGGDLQTCREAFNGKLSLLNISKWVTEIAGALDFIHEQGYLHRDVKPQNILFDGDGRVYLGDFGIAKVVSDSSGTATRLTGTGMVIGTPDYMAPELILEKPCDGRVDQYALGMTIYECLAGRMPFDAKNAAAIFLQHTSAKFPPPSDFDPSIPDEVCKVLLRCLSKKPDRRYATCVAFAGALAKAIAKTSSPTQHIQNQQTQNTRSTRHGRDPQPTVPLTAQQSSIENGFPILQETDTQRLPRQSAPRSALTKVPGAVWLGGGLLLGCGLLIGLIVSLAKPPAGESSPQTSSQSHQETAELESILPSTKPVVASTNPTGPKPAFGQDQTVTTSTGIEMRLVWAGRFKMGSPGTEQGRGANENQVSITLPQSFYLGTHEITQGQWQQVMGTNRWQGAFFAVDDPEHAANYLSWEDAMIFCETLTDIDRKAGRLPNDWIYTLPTAAQWEYACRAGSTTRFSFGEDVSLLQDHAWFWDNAVNLHQEYPHRASEKRPNAFGFYDMHGNVCEWCLDGYLVDLPAGTVPEGFGPVLFRVYRGGSWNNTAVECRSASTAGSSPDDQSAILGFRLAAVSSVEPNGSN